MEENYLIIENGVVTNVVVWDGDPSTWPPPQDSVQLPQATTPALIWDYDSTTSAWSLISVVGAGSAGFTWNGSTLTTNEPQPTAPPKQPASTGTQPL